MSNKSLEKLDSETRDVINYLKNRNEVCDLRIEEFSGATSNQINEWEVKNFCNLPHDLKAFYSNQNGMHVEWKFKLDNSNQIPLGRIQINSLKDLTKVGSVLNKDLRDPSLFDLEDLQEQPEGLITSSTSVSSFSSTSALSFSTNVSNNSSKAKIKYTNTNENHSDEIAEIAKSEGSSDENDLNYENDENESTNQTKNESTSNATLVPHFDETSCNFELDNCNGFGKVCLVYRNTKPGTTSLEQTAEIWFLDRSLQWHFLTHSFQNYYRLLIAHLGLPQWQCLFTEDGLPPFLYQWYYMLAPGRIFIHDNTWKKLEFLSIFETGKPKSQQLQNKSNSKPSNKIEFSKLFDDKQQSKNKSQNNNNSNANPSNNNKGNNAVNSNGNPNNGISKQPKSRITVKK